MKKTVIGIALLVCGIGIDLFLITSALQYLPNLTAWSNSYPSRLFFLIFAGSSQFNDGADGLGLGLFFIIGAVLAIFGIIILAIEYFKKDNS